MAIDWSGAKTPINSHAIALAYCDRGQGSPSFIDHALSRSDIYRWIEGKLNSPLRFLIGIDCNFAYARKIGEQQFGNKYTYFDLWLTVDATSKHLPNYYAEGFWQHDIYGRHFWQAGVKPSYFDDNYQRLTEKICAQNGYGHPESPFKLIGAKQVGKGGLAGMRLIATLKEKYGEKICVWPFEQHFDAAQIVITEIYPRLFLKSAGFHQSKIRDISELNHALSHFRSDPINKSIKMNDHKSDAIIACAGMRHLAGEKEFLPEDIIRPKLMDSKIALQEGWIFGV